MPVTLAQRTFGAVVVEVARQMGLILAQGTATAATGTTLTDATNMRLPVANANDVINKFLYIYGGTSAGTVREITSYGTIGVFTWTGTATTPDTTSTWVLLNADPQYIIDAVAWAQRSLGMDAAVPYKSTSLVSHSLLHYAGDFEEWSAGTAVAPDGWTLSGGTSTVARSTTHRHGLYSAALTPAAGDAGILQYTVDQSLREFLQDEVLTLKGAIAENVASDAVVRVSSISKAGTTTNTDRTGTQTSNRWEMLEDISDATITMPAALHSLVVECRGAAAASAMQFDRLALYGPTLRWQELPYSLLALEPVIYYEGTYGDGDFLVKKPLYHRTDWSVSRASSTNARHILWHNPPPAGRHLFLQGISAPAVVTATATNLNIDADLVAAVAAGHLAGASNDLQAEARRMRRKLSTITNRGSLVWVEDSLATT